MEGGCCHPEHEEIIRSVLWKDSRNFSSKERHVNVFRGYEWGQGEREGRTHNILNQLHKIQTRRKVVSCRYQKNHSRLYLLERNTCG